MTDQPRRRNIEIKARCADLSAARECCRALGATALSVERQRDTYFAAVRGRLKLREIEGRDAALIGYERPDQAAARASDYQIVSVPEPERLIEVLGAALGVRVVVNKQREVFLYRNVRIHLDTVEELGTFLEFEAVMGPGQSDAEGRDVIEELRKRFGIQDGDLVAVSYADLLSHLSGTSYSV